MSRLLLGVFIVGSLLSGVAEIRGDDDLQQAIAKDRRAIEGTWRIVYLEIDGRVSKEEDARKLKVVNGSDGTWALWAEDKEVARGTSEIDPGKTPKHLDFTLTDGEGKGKQFQGIYELGEKTRRMCFAGEGKERPAEFAAPEGSGHVLLRFEREAK